MHYGRTAGPQYAAVRLELEGENERERVKTRASATDEGKIIKEHRFEKTKKLSALL